MPEAGAQTCSGGLSFNFAPLQFAAAPAWSAAATALSPSLAYGSDRLFGIASADVHWLRSAGQRRAYSIGGAIGANQPIRLDNRLHVCPTVSAGYAWSGGGNHLARAAGISVGWLAHNGAVLALIPTAAVGYGNDAANTDDVVRVDLGIGFRVRSRYALTPRVTLTPDDSSQTAIGVSVSVRP